MEQAHHAGAVFLEQVDQFVAKDGGVFVVEDVGDGVVDQGVTSVDAELGDERAALPGGHGEFGLVAAPGLVEGEEFFADAGDTELEHGITGAFFGPDGEAPALGVGRDGLEVGSKILATAGAEERERALTVGLGGSVSLHELDLLADIEAAVELKVGILFPPPDEVTTEAAAAEGGLEHEAVAVPAAAGQHGEGFVENEDRGGDLLLGVGVDEGVLGDVDDFAGFPLIRAGEDAVGGALKDIEERAAAGVGVRGERGGEGAIAVELVDGDEQAAEGALEIHLERAFLDRAFEGIAAGVVEADAADFGDEDLVGDADRGLGEEWGGGSDAGEKQGRQSGWAEAGRGLHGIGRQNEKFFHGGEVETRLRYEGGKKMRR